MKMNKDIVRKKFSEHNRGGILSPLNSMNFAKIKES